MTSTRTLQSDRFEIRAAPGNVYTVIETTEQVETTLLSDAPRRWETLRKSYQILDGGSVLRIDSTTFFVVATGETAIRS